MTFRNPTPRRDPFPASSAGGLTTLPRRLLTVARIPMNGSQVRVRVIIPDDEVIHLISARKPADVTDAAMIAEDALALRVPFLGQAHTAGTALPLTGSHELISSHDLH